MLRGYLLLCYVHYVLFKDISHCAMCYYILLQGYFCCAMYGIFSLRNLLLFDMQYIQLRGYFTAMSFVAYPFITEIYYYAMCRFTLLWGYLLLFYLLFVVYLRPYFRIFTAMYAFLYPSSRLSVSPRADLRNINS
jgi:hypothetical protein